jgi:hypothetical protein
VRLFETAVGDKPGKTELWISEFSGRNTLFREYEAQKKINVEIDALDKFISCGVDLIKIDAEGAEPLIWRGMQKIIEISPDTLQIIIEFAPSHLARAKVDPAEFLQEIKKAGFCIYTIEAMSGCIRLVDDIAECLEFYSVNLLLNRGIIPKDVKVENR